jgi:hypothetical protein
MQAAMEAATQAAKMCWIDKRNAGVGPPRSTNEENDHVGIR